METVATRGRRRSEKLEEIVMKLNLESKDVTGVSTCSVDKNISIFENIHVTSGKLGRSEKSTTSTLGTSISNSKNNLEFLNHHDHDHCVKNRKRARESDSGDGRGLGMRKRWRGPSLGK